MSEPPFASIPELRTARLRLRAWTDDDLEPFARMNADRSVMEFFPAVLTRAESDAVAGRIRAHFAAHGFGLWAVDVLGATSFIGFVGLSYPHLPPPLEPRVEIGWRLARAAWGLGYATEGARAALDAAFDRIGFEEVVSMTAVANVRSRRVMERLGMVRLPSDDFDHPKIPPEHPLRRHVLYRVTKLR